MAEKAGIIVMVIMGVITAVMVTTLLAAEGGEESTVEAAGEGFVCLEGLPLSPELQEYTYRQGAEKGLDYALMLGIMEQESDFRFNVVSGGNYGLFQINEINFPKLRSEIGTDDLLNPYQNIRAAAYLLGELKAKYEADSMVLMAYNKGEGGARRFWQKGVYGTDYTKGVFEKAENYKAAIDAAKKGEEA